MSTNAPYDRPAADGRHPVHVTHLVMGLVFLGIVVVWALVQADLVGGDDVRWLLPVPWVLAGGAGLLATTLSARRRRSGELRGADAHPAHPGYSSYADDQGYGDYPGFPTDSSAAADPTYATGPTDPTYATDPTDTTEEIR